MFFYNPLEQFEIKLLYPLHLYWKCPVFDVSITNGMITLVLVIAAFLYFHFNYTKFSLFFSFIWQYLLEQLFSFILSMLGQQNTQNHSLRFFPFLYTLFMLILFSNIFGLFPYAFTVTSHIYVTFSLAFILFFGVTFFGLYYNYLTFFKFFIPAGVPSFLLAFLVLIEVTSYFIRPFSLSIRLFANMLAGHTLLFIVGNFAVSVLTSAIFFSIIPFLALFLVFLLEFAIAFIQTYVFVILSCLYINDMYNVDAH